MKKLNLVLLLAVSLAGVGTAIGADQDKVQAPGVVVTKSESQSVFKGFLYRVWGKLRSMSPKPRRSRSSYSVTAGIRGAETTTSIINPYWKDDRTDDPGYLEELSSYSGAQQMAEDGNLAGAVGALNEFISKYPDSDLAPNAQFALAISQGGLGKEKESVQTLQSFIEAYPKHPLVADAQEVMAQFK